MEVIEWEAGYGVNVTKSLKKEIVLLISKGFKIKQVIPTVYNVDCGYKITHVLILVEV